MQCVAVCCSEVQCVAACYSVCRGHVHVRSNHHNKSLCVHMWSPRVCCFVCVFACERENVCSSCNTLLLTATHYYTLQHTATHCNTLQHTATHRNTPQYTAPHRNTLLHTATQCCTLHLTAIKCNTLQHTATTYIHLCV